MRVKIALDQHLPAKAIFWRGDRAGEYTVVTSEPKCIMKDCFPQSDWQNKPLEHWIRLTFVLYRNRDVGKKGRGLPLEWGHSEHLEFRMFDPAVFEKIKEIMRGEIEICVVWPSAAEFYNDSEQFVIKRK